MIDMIAETFDAFAFVRKAITICAHCGKMYVHHVEGTEKCPFMATNFLSEFPHERPSTNAGAANQGSRGEVIEELERIVRGVAHDRPPQGDPENTSSETREPEEGHRNLKEDQMKIGIVSGDQLKKLKDWRPRRVLNKLAADAPKPYEIPVNGKYGAPMGRPSVEVMGKVHLRRVPFYDGDYDKGGAYWGGPSDLWCAWNDEGTCYLRAPTREMAKLSLGPGCGFYR